MSFRDLARDIADDFADAAAEHREFFGEGFSVFTRRAKTLRRPAGAPEAARTVLPASARAGFESRGTPHSIEDELVGTTWGDEASLEAQARRRIR